MVIQHVHYIASAPFQSIVLFFLNIVKYRLQVWFRRRDRAGSVVRLVLGHRIKGICCLLLWCLYSNCCGGLSYFITLCTAKYGANTRAANDPSVFTITEKAPTRAFFWFKAPNSSFTFKTLWPLIVC